MKYAIIDIETTGMGIQGNKITEIAVFIHNGKEYKVGTGEHGPVALKLRQALNDIQWGRAEDKHNWLTKVV